MARILQTAYHKQGNIFKTEDDLIRSEEKNYTDRSKDLYKKLNISYSKFYKMDLLCRSAFLCAERLMQGIELDYDHNRVGIFIANNASSLDTDELYYNKSIAAEVPLKHPALFVYTLPNIMLGELSIRHGFKGEQCMWIDEAFNTEFVSNYVNSLFDNNKIDACIIGWVDFYNNKENVFLSWVDGALATENNKLSPNNLETIKKYLNKIS